MPWVLVMAVIVLLSVQALYLLLRNSAQRKGARVVGNLVSLER
jgi:hypothetical protein